MEPLKFNIVSGLWLLFAIPVIINARKGISRSEVRGSRAFGFLNLSIAWYLVFAALELMSRTIEQVLFFTHLEYLALCAFPVEILAFTFSFLDIEFKLKKLVLFTAGVFSSAVLLLQWTTARHNLFYANPRLIPYQDLLVIKFEKGPVYFLWVAVLLMVITSAALLFIQRTYHSRGLVKKQLFIISVAMCLPLIVSLLYVFQAIPIPYDFNLFSYILISILTSYALFRAKMLEFAPVGDDKVFEFLREGCMILDEHHTIININNAAIELLPNIGEKLIGKTIQQALPTCENLIASLVNDVPATIECDGSVFGGPEHLTVKTSPIKAKANQVLGWLITMENTNERFQLLEELQHFATHDDLTGLCNRRFFFEQVHKLLGTDTPQVLTCAFIMLDIDDFKTINDSMGHQTGDGVLQAVSVCISQTITPDALACRFGGDEFLLFLPGMDLKAAMEEAIQLRQAISEMDSNRNSVANITVSIGVAAAALYTAEDIDMLISAADKALYKAKRAGKNQVASQETLVTQTLKPRN